jgi:hypothetical protein
MRFLWTNLFGFYGHAKICSVWFEAAWSGMDRAAAWTVTVVNHAATRETIVLMTRISLDVSFSLESILGY